MAGSPESNAKGSGAAMRGVLGRHELIVAPDEEPMWFYASARSIITIAILILPIIYDSAVPERAGDPRWMLLHLVLAVVAALSILARVATGRSLRASRIPLAGWCYAALTTSAVLSCIDTVDPYLSLWSLKHSLALCALFYFVYILRHRGWYVMLAWALFAPILFNGFLAVVQYYEIDDSAITQVIPYWKYFSFVGYFESPRSASPAASFVNRNLMASWLVMALPLGFYLLVRGGRAATVTLISFILCLGFVSLVFSNSRASWVSSIAAAIPILIFAAIRPSVSGDTEQNSSLRWKYLLALSSPIWLAAAALSPSIGLDTKIGVRAASIFQFDNSYQGRLAFNVNGLQIALDHPVNGTGIGTFRSIYPSYHSAHIPTPAEAYGPHVRPDRAHNDILQTFIELGLIGGFSLVGIFFASLVVSYRSLRNDCINPVNLLSLFLMSSISGLAVNCSLDFPLQMPTAATLLAVETAMIAGIWSMQTAAKSEPVVQSSNRRQRAFYAGLVTFLLLTSATCIDDFRRREGMKKFNYAGYGVIHDKITNKTLRKLDEAYELYSWDRKIIEFRARAYGSNGGLSAAPLNQIRNVIESATQTDTSSEIVLFYLGRVYQIFALRAALKGDANRTIIFSNMALKVHRELVRMSPNSASGWILGGFAWLTLEDTARATALLNQAINLHIEDRNAIRVKNIIVARQNGESFEKIAPDVVEVMTSMLY